MINRLLVGCTAAALAAALTPALAQTAPPPGVAQGTAVPPPLLDRHVPPVIRTNRAAIADMHAEAMTRDAMLRHVSRMFAMADANHDGFITRSEAEAFEGKMMHAAGIGERLRAGRFEGASAGRAALFERLDSNHDGVISRQEFMAAPPALHERRMLVVRHGRDAREADMPAMGAMDANGMAMHEMHMREMGMHRGFAAHLFAMADANHDGRISLEEAEAAALAHFDRVDLNHDGKITPDERRLAHQRMAAGHHHRD